MNIAANVTSVTYSYFSVFPTLERKFLVPSHYSWRFDT
jgi:hypothetical protein